MRKKSTHGTNITNNVYNGHIKTKSKDMVMEMRCNGKKLNPGDKIFKSSKIDLVLGDGKIGFEEENNNNDINSDTIQTDLNNEQ